MRTHRTTKLFAAALAAAALAPAALAEEEIRIGACQPITGRFAFAGVNINAGLQDYLSWANEQGLVKGKKLTYIYEDSGYDTDKAVATFKKIMAQYSPVIMYGESTGLGKAIAPELNSRYKVLYASASFSSELADPKTHPYSFVSGPTYSDMFGILLDYIARNPKGKGKPRVAFFYSDTEFGKDPIAHAKKRAAELGVEVVAEIVTKVGAVDVTTVEVDGVAIPASATSGWRLVDKSRIELAGDYSFTKGVANVVVTYSSGFKVDPWNIPGDIEGAVIECAAMKWKERERIGQVSKMVAGENIDFRGSPVWATFKSVAESYHRTVI